jgi:dTDP-4-dehydrorhamnose 3,5-epimerase
MRMKRFEVVATPLGGLKVVSRKPLGDNRGYFERLFCEAELGDLLAGKGVVQVNHTLTARKGAVRGMHFQWPPHAETKFVSCLKGEVFDVAVDLRRRSPTFMKWHGEILSAANHRSLLIPDGFAHGFQALTGDCELLYLHTAGYEPTMEGALNATDPALAIAWPLPISDMSDRDRAHPMVTAAFQGVDA